MHYSHQECRRDLDLVAAGERIADISRIRGHLRGCNKCQSYFNKLGAEGRHREGTPSSVFERNFSEQVLQAFLASLPPQEEIFAQERRRQRRRRFRRLLFSLGCFLGGVAAMLLYLHFFE